MVPRALMRQLVRGGDEAVWGAWALGRFSDLPGRQRGAIYEALVAATRNGSPELRREATIALSRLQYRAVEKVLTKELRATLTETPNDRRLIYSAGWVQSMKSVPELAALLQGGDADGHQCRTRACGVSHGVQGELPIRDRCRGVNECGPDTKPSMRIATNYEPSQISNGRSRARREARRSHADK